MTDVKFGNNIDMSKQQVKNIVIHTAATASAPADPVEGQLWHDSTTHQLKSWNGSAWVVCAAVTYSEGTGIDISGTTVAVDSTYSGFFPNNVYSALIGNGSDAEIAVTHSLGKQWVIAVLYEVSSKVGWIVPCVATSTSVATFSFSTIPTSNQFRVVIIGCA